MQKVWISIAFVLACCQLLWNSESIASQDPVEDVSGSEAPFDLSSLSLDELLALREQVNREIDEKGYTLYYDLSRGDKGEEVSRLQERLRELGYYTGPISGKYDTETQKAMKQFEKANDLTNDGQASREDQTLLYSADIGPKATPTAKPTRTPLPTVEEDGAFSEYGDYDYTQISRYPEAHQGEKVKIIGKVVQVLGDRSAGLEVRLATAGNSDVIYLFIAYDPGYNILDNDRLTVYATLNGTVTYETVLGNSVTIPSAVADTVLLR